MTTLKTAALKLAARLMIAILSRRTDAEAVQTRFELQAELDRMG